MNMPKSPRYTDDHAKSGLSTKFPEIETWPNQFPTYEIVIDVPEFTSVCPKTGLPDFGTIIIQVLEDVVKYTKPKWAVVEGDFRPRGGIGTKVFARWPRNKK